MSTTPIDWKLPIEWVDDDRRRVRYEPTVSAILDDGSAVVHWHTESVFDAAVYAADSRAIRNVAPKAETVQQVREWFDTENLRYISRTHDWARVYSELAERMARAVLAEGKL